MMKPFLFGMLSSVALLSNLALAAPEGVCIVDVRQNDREVDQVSLTVPSSGYNGVIENIRLSISIPGGQVLEVSATDSRDDKQVLQSASVAFRDGRALTQVSNGPYILDITCR